MSNSTILIIGAGPAGAAASIYLSKAGIAHTIVDKAVFPRDKVCGDACSGKSAYVLRNADPAWMPELLAHTGEVHPARGIVFGAPNGRNLAVPFNSDQPEHGEPLGFCVPRLFFDHFLFQKLASPYATILAGAGIAGIRREADGGFVATLGGGATPQVVRARCIIGADGDKGVARRALLTGVADAKSAAVGLRAYYSNVAPLREHFIELHFLPGLLPGYLWIFPLAGGRANVGVGMLSSDVRARKINLRERFLKCIAESPVLRDRFKDAQLEGRILGWGLPMGTRRQPVSGDGFVLCGDAASLIDPFSGEGIGNALYSGMKAAQALEKAVRASDFSAASLKEWYADPLWRRIESELRTSYILQRLCRYPALFNLVVNKAHRSPALMQTISSMFGDEDLRKKMRNPGFYLRMLLNR